MAELRQQEQRQSSSSQKFVDSYMAYSFTMASEQEDYERACDDFFCSDVVAYRFYHSDGPIKCSIIDKAKGFLELLPEYCLENGYADFFVSHIDDVDPYVRLACLQALCDCLFKQPSSLLSNLQTLRIFVDRFQDRFCELVYDVDLTVAIAAIEFLRKINSILPDVLTAQQLNAVFLFAFANADQRSPAASAFLHESLLTKSKLFSPSSCKLAEADTPPTAIYLDISSVDCFRIVQADGNETLADKSNLVYLTKLGLFVNRFGSDLNIPKFVVNLLPISPSIRDWNAYIYLFVNYGNGSQNDFAVFGLLRFLPKLATCLKGKAINGKVGNGLELNRTDAWQEWKSMNDCLMPALPRILRHFLTLPDSGQQHVVFLLQLLPCFDLTANRSIQRETISCLLEIIQRSSNSQVLSATAFMLKRSPADDENGVNRLLAAFKSAVTKAADNATSKNGSTVANDTTLLVLNKLIVLGQYFDTSTLQLEEQCFAILQQTPEGTISYGEIFNAAIQFVFLSLKWLSAKIEEPAAKASYHASKGSDQMLKKEHFSKIFKELTNHLQGILRRSELSYLFQQTLQYLEILRVSFPAWDSSHSSKESNGLSPSPSKQLSPAKSDLPSERRD